MISNRTSEKPWVEWAERRLGRPLDELLADAGIYPGGQGVKVLPLPDAARLLRWTEDEVRNKFFVSRDFNRREMVEVKSLWTLTVEGSGSQRGIVGRADILGALQDESVVYFIQGAGLTKIGTSVNVSMRLCDLRVGSPVPLEVVWVTPGGPSDEAALHIRYATERRHGEWFCLSHDDMREIVAEHPLPQGFRRTRGSFSYACTCGVVYTWGGAAARRCHEDHDEDVA